MIINFPSEEAEIIFNGGVSRKLPREIQSVAFRKLGYVDAAGDLRDLRAPPGNRLEELKDDRKGQHSIRINDQWRVCFVWDHGNARDVEIVDYH
jgi:proteic killer suppression protein